MKKDRMFVLVMGVVMVPLVLSTAARISSLVANPTHFGIWCWFIANIVAIIGWFWLFREYKRGIRRARREAEAD